MVQTLNRHQAQWSLYLSQFDYSLTHRAGKHSAKPDALSRCVNHQVKGQDNEDQVMLPTEHFASEPLGQPAGQDPLAECLRAEGTVRVTLRRGHLYTKILRDRGELNRRDTLTQW